jgi:hypothetical protein
MKKRAHVLHNALDGCVQRKDYEIIRPLLPSKNEYVLLIRLSPKQIALYENYLLNQRGINNTNIGKIQNIQLFADFNVLSRIWTHPWVLKLNAMRMAKIEERSIKNFIVDDHTSGDETDNDENKGLTNTKQLIYDSEIEEIDYISPKLTVTAKSENFDSDNELAIETDSTVYSELQSDSNNTLIKPIK